MDCADAERGKPFGGLGTDAPQRVGRAVSQDRVPGLVCQPEDTGGLAEPGGQLGLKLVLADADRAFQAGRRADAVLDQAGDRLRILGVDREERLVPAEHLHGHPEVPQRLHHHRRGRLIRFPVHRQEDRIGTAPVGGAQRLARMHPESTRFVRRGADHATFGRVAVTPDHHRAPPQLGMTQHLDSGDELVEVHVQHPAGHAPVSLPVSPGVTRET
jgi:hypothetical protein